MVFRNIHTTFRRVMRFSTFFAGPLLNLKRGMRPAVSLIADQFDAPRSLKLKEPITADRKFEDVVKSAQDAAVLVLVY
jgi:hypothetical protein